MSKVTIAASQEPKLDQQLQALAAFWEKDEKWWHAPNTNPAVAWCFENRVAIVALHSSENETPIFQVYVLTPIAFIFFVLARNLGPNKLSVSLLVVNVGTSTACSRTASARMIGL